MTYVIGKMINHLIAVIEHIIAAKDLDMLVESSCLALLRLLLQLLKQHLSKASVRLACIDTR